MGERGGPVIEQRGTVRVGIKHPEDFGGELAVLATGGVEEWPLSGRRQIDGGVEQRLDST